MDDIQKLRIYYGALTGLLDTVSAAREYNLSGRMVVDYSKIYDEICEIVDVELTYLAPNTLKQVAYGHEGSREMRVDITEFISKCKQLRSILESGYNVTDKIVQIGSLFNSIKDEELRSRCADLLTAHDHFDRVVNQATQVLESRIKTKSGSDKSGKPLIGETIKSDLSSTVLILSNNPNEQEGYGSILRGLMQTMRNSSHHSFSKNYTREDAFAVCGFVDQLLRVIDRSTVNTG